MLVKSAVLSADSLVIQQIYARFMDDPTRDFLFNLLNTPSPTGFEAAGQRVWAGYLADHADAVETDTYGSAWATLDGTGADAPALMLDAHVDEIGYMVRHITDEGFLYVTRIGGSDPAIARDHRVRILTAEGPVRGVIGQSAIHLRERDDEKTPDVHDLFVDVGATSREEVEERGLRVGQPMVFDVEATHLTEERVTGRALDNRLGGFIMAQVVRRLAEDPPASTVYATNSVQEEIGGYGAKMIAHRLQPDVAVAFDVTHATDSPGLDPKKHGATKMGEGPAVTHGTSTHPKVVERLIETAEAEEISIQHEPSARRTGTDTDSIFNVRSGVPSGLVSVPLRYMHSTVEVVDLGDVEDCVALLTAFAHSLQPGDSFRVEV